MKNTLSAIILFVNIQITVAHATDISRDAEIVSAVNNAPYISTYLELYQNRIAKTANTDPISKEFDLYLRRFNRKNAKLQAATKIFPVEGSASKANDMDVNCWNVDFAINETSGRLLVVWEDERNGVNNPDIWGQVYNTQMDRIGTNFIIHQADSKAQTNPSVVATSDGGFVVAWEQQESYGQDIFLRKYNSSVNPSSGQVRLDAGIASTKFSPNLAADNYGNMMITWLQDDIGTFNIYFRKFKNDLSPVTVTYQIDSDATGIQWFPEIGSLDDGTSLIVWEDFRDGNSDIYAQRIRNDGTKRGSNFRLNEVIDFSTQWRPQVCNGPTGFITVWEDERDSPNAIYAQWLNSSLLLDGGNVRVDNPLKSFVKSYPDITLNEKGESIFCWHENIEGSENILNTASVSPTKNVNGFATITAQDYNGAQTNVVAGYANNFAFFFWLDKADGQDWQDVNGNRFAFASLPVELIAFEAKRFSDYIELSWQTASESNNMGFSVLKRIGAGDFQKACFIEGQGTSSSIKNYVWRDYEINISGHYFYQLQQVDFSGQSKNSNIVEVTVESPDNYALYQNYPNPFNGSTTITFDLASNSNMALNIFNLSGQKIRSLVNTNLYAGKHSLNWDGRNDNGVIVPSGSYIVQMKTEHFSQRNSILFLR